MSLVFVISLSSCAYFPDTRFFLQSEELKDLKYDQTADGWIAQNQRFKITFKSKPAQPVTGQPAEFDLDIFDVAKQSPVSMKNAKIECTSLMPENPGFVRVLAHDKQYPGTTPGACTLLPLQFDAPGKWVVIYLISLESGSTFRIHFPVTVENGK